jgi:hypothetical protein
MYRPHRLGNWRHTLNVNAHVNRSLTTICRRQRWDALTGDERQVRLVIDFAERLSRVLWHEKQKKAGEKLSPCPPGFHFQEYGLLLRMVKDDLIQYVCNCMTTSYEAATIYVTKTIDLIGETDYDDCDSIDTIQNTFYEIGADVYDGDLRKWFALDVEMEKWVFHAMRTTNLQLCTSFTDLLGNAQSAYRLCVADCTLEYLADFVEDRIDYSYDLSRDIRFAP